MIIFAADDPLVLNGTYDREGYTPKERRAQQRKLKGDDMAKRQVTARTKSGKARRGGRWQTVAGKEVTTPKKRTARSASLPGMEDHAIRELENIAAEYVEIRDRRMELTREEHDLKGNAMKAMKKHGKTIYKHGGVTIQIIEGEPDIKVKVKKAGDAEDDAPAEEHAEFADERAEAVDGEDASTL